MHHFGAWAFGYTVTSAFTYNYSTSSLFTPGYNTANPTPNYYQLQEINRQGRNLGPALVRLVSKDVLWLGGQHKDGNGNTVWNSIPIDIKAYPFSGSGYPADGFSSAIKDPWIRGVQSIANLGTKNDGLKGDFLISWFQVLDESLDGSDHSGEWYFMVANGLVDPTGSAVDTRQTIQINYAANVPTQVERLNRDTGQIDLIDLEIIPEHRRPAKAGRDARWGHGRLVQIQYRRTICRGAALGDFNHDNNVDAADYVVWRKNDGTQAGFDLWRAHFGQTAGSGSIVNTAVPEPASAVLMILAAVADRRRRSRRIRSNVPLTH